MAPPGYLLLSLGGHILIVAGFVGLLYRLGGFVPTDQESRSWAILVALLIPWAVLLAFIGPLPLPLVLAADAGFILYYVWAWRTGRFGSDRIPIDVRDEAIRRRLWMRQHIGLMIALAIGALILTLVWALLVAAILR